VDRFVSGLALVFLVVVGLFVLAIKAEQAVEKRPTESYEKCVDDDWSEDVWGEDD
jgi:succinate dehydrogenase hydrophobic anchor subunit